SPCDLLHPYLHSFPTRRSSDLEHVSFGRVYCHSGEFRSNVFDGKTCACWLIDVFLWFVAHPSKPSPDFACLKTSRTSSTVAHSRDRKSTRLNSSHVAISYAVFC